MKSNSENWLNRLLPLNSAWHDKDVARGMVIAIGVGVIAGLGAVVFRHLIGLIETSAFGHGKNILSFLGDYYIVLIPALGGLIVGPLIYFFAPEAKGHGVPEVMIAVAKNGGRIRPRVAFVKILASAITIGTGGSVGREGPIVQIGATLGSTIGQRLGLPAQWIRTLVACGAAGGISATFNAPIAGVFFALEVILGNFTTRYFSVVVISSVVAAVVSHAFLPDVANLIVPEYALESALEIPLYGILGGLAGVLGVIFIIVLYAFEDGFDKIKIPEWVKPVVGGLIIGLLGLYSTDLFGVGYRALESAANGEMLLKTALVLLGLKILATSVTIGSGGSGGVFAPSLFLGAMLGAAFGSTVNALFPSVAGPVGAYAVVGMAAVFSATARAPITAVVILFELTRDYKIILPLMLCVVISTIVSQLIYKESIYTKKMRRKGVEPPGEEMFDALDTVKVSEAMTKDFGSVSRHLPIQDLNQIFTKSGQRGLLVTDDDSGELVGIVTVSDLENSMRENHEIDSVEKITTNDIVTAFPDQTVREALVQFGAGDVGRIPVVSRSNPREIVGVLRRSDIISSYSRVAAEKVPG
ncbi:MAG: chloride channel protein [Verrucomicrobiales bacterium]|nr:chloride channel protein [Verrucomicrobiales bacterium]